MSATDDRTWAEIVAEAEGPSATPDDSKPEVTVIPEGQQTAAQTPSSGVAQPTEQKKAKNKQKGKQNKQVTFVNVPAAAQTDPNAQAQTTNPAGPSTDVKETNVTESQAQGQPEQKGGKEDSKLTEQSPAAVTTVAIPNTGSQAQPTTMCGPYQPLLVQPQAPQPTICGAAVVPRMVHGKRQLFFERPHYNPPEIFKADRSGGRATLPPLSSLLPCFSGYGRQRAAPVFMPPYHPPQQQVQQNAPAIQPAPPTQPNPPTKASSVASSDSSKAAKEKDDKKQEAPATTAPAPPSPITINIFTSNSDGPKVEATEATSAEQQPVANKVKKAKKQTVVTVESDEEEEQEISRPARSANKNKKIVKTTTVTIDDDEDEADVVAKTAKQNPTTVKKPKHTKKIMVEEETSEDEVAATPVQKKSKKTKQADTSSDTSAEQTRPANPRMMGIQTYASKSNADAKTAAKNNDDNSSINSSQRGAKPAPAPNNGPVTHQGGWPSQQPWYPPPMYGGFGPQMWPGMLPPPANSPPMAQKLTGKAASKGMSVSSSSGTGNSLNQSLRPSSKNQHTSQKPASSNHGQKKDSPVPSHVGSATPSDISIHMPRDWRGTIRVKDPKPAKSGPEPAASHGPQPRTASHAPTRAAAEVISTPAAEKVDVYIHHSSPSKPHLSSKSAAQSNYQPPSAISEPPSPNSPHRTPPDTSPKHNRRVWQHPQHADVWEVFSISTRDGYDPGKDREVHPNGSVSQIASVVREEKSGRRRESIKSRSKEEWRGTDDKGRVWEVDVSNKKRVSVPTTVRSRDISTSEKVEKIRLSRVRDLSPHENKSNRRDRSSQSTTRRSERYIHDQDQAPARSRAVSRHTRISSQRATSQISRHDEGDISRKSEQQRSNLGSRTSRRPADDASRRSRDAEQDIDNRVSSRRSRHSRDDQQENRRYREHQSDLSQRSRRNSYRRPEYLEVHEEEKVVEDWGADETKRDGSVQW